MKRKVEYGIDKDTYATLFNRPISKLSLPNAMNTCAVVGCNNKKNIQMHHVKALNRKVLGYIVTSVSTTKNRKSTGLSKIESALNRKQIPLCIQHHNEWHKGKIGVGDLDTEYANQNLKFLGKNKIELRDLNRS